MVKKELGQGGVGLVFVVDDPDLRTEIVLKLIRLGPKDSETRTTN
jgi:hypothetical protein